MVGAKGSSMLNARLIAYEVLFLSGGGRVCVSLPSQITTCTHWSLRQWILITSDGQGGTEFYIAEVKWSEPKA